MKIRARLRRFERDMLAHTPFFILVGLLFVSWLIFSGGVYFAECGAAGTTITSYGRALYWGVAAFSTAGIADAPVTGLAQLIGGLWIVLGSVLFFGTVRLAGRQLNRPLERLEDLTVEELALLKATVDSLIQHMEALRNRRAEVAD